MIVVTGSVTARENSLDEVRKLSLEHVRRSCKEPGCVSHAVHVDCENPLRLVFIEQWADRATLSALFRAAGLARFRPCAAAARRGSYDDRDLRRHKAGKPLNLSTHSWIATPISYCNAT